MEVATKELNALNVEASYLNKEDDSGLSKMRVKPTNKVGLNGRSRKASLGKNRGLGGSEKVMLIQDSSIRS